jgi:hypothetical protein
MRIKDLLEDGRIVKGVNTTADVDTNSISREAAKFGNKVDKDGRPPTLSKKVRGKSTNVLYNLGLAEGQMIPNPPNTFLTKSDTAYDHYKIGTNLANLKAVPKGANYDEPDVVIAPYAGKKEMKYLMKQLKRIGYDVQGAAGYQDAHFDDEPTGGEAPPQVKNYGPLGRVKLGQLRTVQKERSYKKLIKQLERVLKDDYAPIQIDRKGRIVNGHHRYDALRLAGAEYARVHMADDVLEDMLDEGITTIDLKNALEKISKNATNGERLVDVFIMRYQHNMTFKQIGDEIGTGIDRARQVYLRAERMIRKSLQDYDPKVKENFADGKVKGKSRPGRVKRSGASCNGSVTKLRKQAKNASGEKARMYHWCANMKSGRKKKS